MRNSLAMPPPLPLCYQQLPARLHNKAATAAKLSQRTKAGHPPQLASTSGQPPPRLDSHPSAPLSPSNALLYIRSNVVPSARWVEYKRVTGHGGDRNTAMQINYELVFVTNTMSPPTQREHQASYNQ